MHWFCINPSCRGGCGDDDTGVNAVVTPNQLGLLLVERIQEVLPAGFTVECDSERTMLWFKRQGVSGYAGSYALQILVGEGGNVEQRISAACRVALDDLQDFVDEETTDPWPGSKNVPPARAMVEGGQVHLWYGDIEAPALRLRPVPLENLWSD
jgi:hypothetical protein